LREYEKQVILHDQAIEKMAKNTSKPIVFAYREITMKEYV